MTVPIAPPQSIRSRIRQDVQSMHAYAVQDATGLLKLDAMENPHRLPPALRAELGRRLGEVAINRYPGARVDDLRAALHAHARPPAGWKKSTTPTAPSRRKNSCAAPRQPTR